MALFGKGLVQKMPRYSFIFFYYFKRIGIELKKYHWDRGALYPASYMVYFNTNKIDYNFDAITLTKKMFKRLGWQADCVKYLRDINEDKTETHHYSWKITNKPSESTK